MRKFLAYILLLLPGYLSAQENDTLHFRIYDTALKQEITLDDIVSGLTGADVIFFGEEHNDSIAHILQYELLEKLHARYTAIGLSLEMFPSDDQLVLDEYLAGFITEKNFSKDATLWNNYNDYRPLVEYAKLAKLPVLAANAPSRYTNRVTRSGLESLDELSAEAKALIAPLPIDTLEGTYYDKFTGLLGGHDGMGNLKIYQSQNLWDATMAYRIAGFAKEYPEVKILHLNGRFHSDEKLGTVAQLSKYAPSLKVKNISCFADESLADPDWDVYSHLGDYVIITDIALPRSF